MRIVVISDTHITGGSLNLPKDVSDAFKNADMILHAGDLINLSLLEKLKKFCPNVKAVWGNMDPAEVKNKLPQKEIIRIGSHKIGLMHGSGAPDKLLELMHSVFKDTGVDLVVFGHSHSALKEKRNGILFFNPGSLTDKLFAQHNSYGIIEINDKIEAKIVRINNG